MRFLLREGALRRCYIAPREEKIFIAGITCAIIKIEKNMPLVIVIIN